ncbi:TlyA family RNA methyltransferase [Candidatus Dependentiae bacterium]|nr:TlyA family RNA methyltransferase [Candidatus Dependentiae bacterium]
MKKERLDKILLDKKFFNSRTEAQGYILAGKVLVNETPITKSGEKIDTDSEIRIKGELKKYVSRGGDKLEIAVNEFNIDFTNKSVLDIGISTGGFTDCALQSGAESVTGIDVGYGQLDIKIRNNPKVTVIEKTNARTLNLNKQFDIILCDVSFISTIKLLDTFDLHLKQNGRMVILIKPQFEAGQEFIEKGGIVKNLDVHKNVLDEIKKKYNEKKFELTGIAESRILFPKGNIEYLTYWKREI